SPTACSVTRAMKSRTTVKLTSASSSDRSTSLSPSRMFDSVSFPCPRRVLKAEESPSWSDSNIGEAARLVSEGQSLPQTAHFTGHGPRSTTVGRRPLDPLPAAKQGEHPAGHKQHEEDHPPETCRVPTSGERDVHAVKPRQQ